MTAASILDKETTSLAIKHSSLQIPNKNSLQEKKDKMKKQNARKEKIIAQKREHVRIL